MMCGLVRRYRGVGGRRKCTRGCCTLEIHLADEVKGKNESAAVTWASSQDAGDTGHGGRHSSYLPRTKQRRKELRDRRPCFISAAHLTALSTTLQKCIVIFYWNCKDVNDFEGTGRSVVLEDAIMRRGGISSSRSRRFTSSVRTSPNWIYEANNFWQFWIKFHNIVKGCLYK